MESCNCDNITFSILQDDKLTVELLPGVETDDISLIHRIHLDFALLHEGSSKYDVEVRLLREVNGVNSFCTPNSDGPLANAA